MAKAIFIVCSQRSDGAAYIDCEPHRATSWAVKKRFKLNGRTVLQVVSRHLTRNQAQGDADYRTRAMQPIERAYKLGKRMGLKKDLARERAVLASVGSGVANG